jgi:hypothetical protein
LIRPGLIRFQQAGRGNAAGLFALPGRIKGGTTMKRLIAVMLLLASVFLSGCSGDADRGKYKDKDRPHSAEKAPS